MVGKLFLRLFRELLAGQKDDPPTETVSLKDVVSAFVNDVLSSMSEKDRKNFAGGASINNDGVASYNLLIFADEQALLGTHDIAAFAKAGRRRYLDIAASDRPPQARSCVRPKGRPW